MKPSLAKSVRFLLGAGMVFAADVSISITPAHAIIGRTLTPMSYAGVARRSIY